MESIIILSKDGERETWTQLTDVCDAHSDFSYNYLKSKKFPFTYKGYTFTKVEHKTRLI